MKKILLVSVTLFTNVCLNYSFGQKKDLTYDQIFKGAPTGIFKPLPDITGWLDDDHYLESRPGQTGNSQIYSVEAKTGKSVPYNAAQSPDKAGSRVHIKNDDVYLTQGSLVERQITKSAEKEINPSLSPDNKWVAFTRNNNLYAVEITSGKEIKFTSDGSDVVYNGYASWVYFEEILGRASRYKAFWWSTDSKHICFMRFNDAQVPVFPIYNAEGQHGFLENTRYPKAGDKNPEVKIGVVSVDNPLIVWGDFDEKNDQYFGTPVWTPGGNLWIQWMPRSQDNLKIYDIDLNSGTKKEIYDEQQKTWIDLDNFDRINFLEGGGFILSSDKSGWAHLYLHDKSGKRINAITAGNFTVSDIKYIDQKNKLVYFTARRENSARTDLYKVSLDGKGLTRLTFGEFTHTTNSSPSFKYFISMYSNVSTPTRMALVDGKGKVVRELGGIKGEDFDTYNFPRSELVRVKSADGLFDLPMTITYPLNYDHTRKYPVLINIYGGPNAGTVYDSWKLTDGPVAWWAKEGIVQVAMDNRSSGHFGKQGMNYIYRQLGKYEIEDYMQCARWLKTQTFIDSSKICITGGSFGGYMTFMALTYGAKEFTHGIANASVTDWRLYDTHYTERFMDTPQENPEGYKNTAVLTYANNYKGMLRIVHGATDDNVHMQNSIQMIDQLQNLQKHFEFMLYPGERHGIGANNRLKAAHNRLEAYHFYYKYLLNKPMPQSFIAD